LEEYEKGMKSLQTVRGLNTIYMCCGPCLHAEEKFEENKLVQQYTSPHIGHRNGSHHDNGADQESLCPSFQCQLFAESTPRHENFKGISLTPSGEVGFVAPAVIFSTMASGLICGLGAMAGCLFLGLPEALSHAVLLVHGSEPR